MTTGFAIIAWSLIAVAGYGAIEYWAYKTGRPLITTKVRDWNRRTHGMVAVAITAPVAFTWGHFFWCGG